MEYQFLNEDSKDIALIKSIYSEAFPKEERIPFHYLTQINPPKNELIGFYHHQHLCGFIAICTYEKISNVVYFAIKKEYRAQGLGSKALHILQEIKKDHLIMVDIEKIDDTQENNDIRIKRKQFYLKNGFCENDIYRTWNNEEYEVLSFNGQLKKGDYEKFWENFFNSLTV